MTKKSKKSNDLAQRLLQWYAGGEKGLMTLCAEEGLPDSVKKAVQRWYDKGRTRLNAIAREIEKNG